MLFDAIFLTLFFLTWILLGGLPWIAVSLRRHADGALWALPFALMGGAGGGAVIPLLGPEDGMGVGISMVGALLGGGFLTGAAFRAWDTYDLGARFARWEVHSDPPPETHPPGPPRPTPSEHTAPTIDSDANLGKADERE